MITEVEQKPNLQALVKQAEDRFFPWLIKWNIESLVIENDEQLKHCSDLLGIGKGLEKAVEAHRVEEKAPSLAEGKRIDDEHAPVKNRINLGVKKLDNAIVIYQKKKKKFNDDLLALQAADIENKRKAADAAQISVMQSNLARKEECEQTGEVYEEQPLPPMPEQEAPIVQPVRQTIRGNMTSTTIVDSFDFVIIDDDAIERALCSGDMKKIKAYHKAQTILHPKEAIVIKGVLITPKSSTSTRFT